MPGGRCGARSASCATVMCWRGVSCVVGTVAGAGCRQSEMGIGPVGEGGAGIADADLVRMPSGG
jgi:hypothetical protein